MFVLDSPNIKGNVAELEIVMAAVRLGIPVLRPIGEHGRSDLAFEIGDRLWRVQCKWASRRGQTLIVSCESARRCADGFIRRRYTAEEVDAVGAYNLEFDRCFLIPIARVENRPAISLRFAPCLNNQRRRINWADDFDFAATIRRQGAVAQLEERESGRLEATGSSPVGSMF